MIYKANSSTVVLNSHVKRRIFSFQCSTPRPGCYIWVYQETEGNTNLHKYGFLLICEWQFQYFSYWHQSILIHVESWHILGWILQLKYASKHIHFGTDTFIMRMNLACMDWVSQKYLLMYKLYLHLWLEWECWKTIHKWVFIQDTRRPDQQTPFLVLVNKSFKFVDKIWKVFIETNCQDIRYQLLIRSYKCLLFQFFTPINKKALS